MAGWGNKILHTLDQFWASSELKAKHLGTRYTLSAAVLNRLANFTQKKQIDYADQAKAATNSILLFHSQNAHYLSRIRQMNFAMPIILFLFAPIKSPFYAYLAYLALSEPLAINYCRNFVTRMDLLPHTEQLAIQKVGFLGLTRTELVQIKNLQKIDFEKAITAPIYDQSKGIDKNFMWKDLDTNIEYAFDINGKWNEEGLKHPLIY